MAVKWFFYLFSLIYLVYTKKINTIHCFAMPSGGIGYIISMLTGKELIIDSYEPHAESMVENGTWSANGLAYKISNFLEYKQSHRATKFIAATSGMKNYALTRFDKTIADKDFFVKPACVDLALFNPDKFDRISIRKDLELVDNIVCVYAGKLGGIYLEEEVFDFIKCAENYWGERFRFLFLTNTEPAYIQAMSAKKEISPKTIFTTFVPHQEIPRYMAAADFGLTPVKPVKTKRYCTPIKDGEYWAMGLPVVITKDISDDSEIIKANDIGYVLHELSTAEYLLALNKINELLQGDKLNLQLKIRAVAKKYRNFDLAHSIYSTIYDDKQ
jgi:glycosyltransferase involved in cell wall biosynthesis